MSLSHFDAQGQAYMVDVSDKEVSARLATAEGCVVMHADTLAHVLAGSAKKGDVLGIARLAGIMAAKQTAALIPLCHPLPISKVALELWPDSDLPGVRITATVKTTGQTGVEMEALTAVSVAALTVYDMLKAVEKSMRIEGIRVVLKEGGKSGRYAPDEGTQDGLPEPLSDTETGGRLAEFPALPLTLPPTPPPGQASADKAGDGQPPKGDKA